VTEPSDAEEKRAARAPSELRDLVDFLQPDFATAHVQRVEVMVGDVPVRVLSLEDLIVAKRAAGRPQDLADIVHLEQIRAKRGEP